MSSIFTRLRNIYRGIGVYVIGDYDQRKFELPVAVLQEPALALTMPIPHSHGETDMYSLHDCIYTEDDTMNSSESSKSTGTTGYFVSAETLVTSAGNAEIPIASADITETPVASAETLVTSADIAETPVASAETPVASAETPVASAETPVASAETPVASAETPIASAETPVASAETPVASAETPVASAETPVASAETPVASAETPVASADNTDTPVTPAETPVASADDTETPVAPADITETPVTSAEAPVASADIVETPVDYFMSSSITETPVTSAGNMAEASADQFTVAGTTLTTVDRLTSADKTEISDMRENSGYFGLTNPEMRGTALVEESLSRLQSPWSESSQFSLHEDTDGRKSISLYNVAPLPKTHTGHDMTPLSAYCDTPTSNILPVLDYFSPEKGGLLPLSDEAHYLCQEEIPNLQMVVSPPSSESPYLYHLTNTDTVVRDHKTTPGRSNLDKPYRNN
jgi:hypothetical protein